MVKTTKGDDWINPSTTPTISVGIRTTLLFPCRAKCPVQSFQGIGSRQVISERHNRRQVESPWSPPHISGNHGLAQCCGISWSRQASCSRILEVKSPKEQNYPGAGALSTRWNNWKKYTRDSHPGRTRPRDEEVFIDENGRQWTNERSEF